MRTPQPRPKKLTKVDIPARLQAFLRDVADSIDRHDDSATIPSDDLLQCEYAYGGLLRGGADLYAFTYFPRAGTRARWQLQLSADEISALADGTDRQLGLWACTDEACGSMFYSSSELCSSCDYVDHDPQPETKLPPGRFRSRRAWAAAYFALNPAADVVRMICDYSGSPQLREKLGFFSVDEISEMIKKKPKSRRRPPR